ncbi:3-oxoacid CoA-transferase subunit B [Bordetella sp. 15P40C-2]|uniref:3-oxoacid CoA-transferase subunit B n=1 Tax=Bordetella sp. 15P40C-2 TaxID=2572246 RepID=UPI0013232921|nr:3-oxoacid CoA-transferase subunit B [Bordetella sp. 15P40C-2]MVW71188.1 3-oxoacid CoA-transferase subunit B [Bordetella sp. 15P40C-2]
MVKKLSRQEIAQRVAGDIPDGYYVNLGIGIPTLVARYLPDDRDVLLHTENGIVGMGPGDPDAPLDLDLINASKESVTLIPGSSITDHVVSFAMMRGGHIDLTILGAFQVSASGDLANWDTGHPEAIPAVGGAMDLAVGAKRVYVTMEHVTRDNAPKIVQQCTYPLTGYGVVDRIYTDLAVIDVTQHGLIVTGMVDGLRFDELQALTGAPLTPGDTIVRLS